MDGGSTDAGAGTDAGAECPAYEGTGPVCTGSYTVSNSLDLMAVQPCVRITGHLTVDSAGLGAIELSNLQRVDGNITITGVSGTPSIRFPELREVGGYFDTYDTTGLSVVSMNKLGFVVDALGTHTSIEASCLTWAGALGLHGGATSLPRLTEVRGNLVDGPLDAPLLTHVDGALRFVDGTRTPLLETVGELQLEPGLTALDLPALRTIVGDFNAVSPGGPPVLVTLSLPSLETVGRLVINAWPELTAVDLPLLREITPTDPSTEALVITASAGLSSVDLPSLELVSGPARISVTLTANALIEVRTTSSSVGLQANALTTVRGRLEIGGLLIAPSLTTVTGQLYYTSSATATLSLPALERAGSVWIESSSLSSLDLSGLTTTTNIILRVPDADVALTSLISADNIRVREASSLSAPVLTATSGEVYVRRASTVTSVSMASLETVGDILYISTNEILGSISFPSLTAAVSLTIETNPCLPATQATDLEAQMRAAGWTGAAYIENNGGRVGTSRCP